MSDQFGKALIEECNRRLFVAPFALRIVSYPLGNTSRVAAEMCGELLRTVFDVAENDSLTMRHSKVCLSPTG